MFGGGQTTTSRSTAAEGGARGAQEALPLTDSINEMANTYLNGDAVWLSMFVQDTAAGKCWDG
jgi:hypothetical protein